MDELNNETKTEVTGAGMTRRQMLKTAAGLLLLPMLPSLVLADDVKENWVAVGKSEDFVKDQPKKVTLDSGSVVYVTRQAKDTLTTLSARCTHRGCTVAWQDSDSQFHCPCHGAIFAKSGKDVRGSNRNPDPTLAPLAAVPTRIKDGQVQINAAAVPANVMAQ